MALYDSSSTVCSRFDLHGCNRCSEPIPLESFLFDQKTLLRLHLTAICLYILTKNSTASLES